MNERMTYTPDEKPRAMTRGDRRQFMKGMKRNAKKLHRRALHGVTTANTPPTQLQMLRMGALIQRKQREVDALMRIPQAVLDEPPVGVTACALPQLD